MRNGGNGGNGTLGDCRKNRSTGGLERLTDIRHDALLIINGNTGIITGCFNF
jgi:hypothetical protein